MRRVGIDESEILGFMAGWEHERAISITVQWREPQAVSPQEDKYPHPQPPSHSYKLLSLRRQSLLSEYLSLPLHLTQGYLVVSRRCAQDPGPDV